MIVRVQILYKYLLNGKRKMKKNITFDGINDPSSVVTLQNVTPNAMMSFLLYRSPK